MNMELGTFKSLLSRTLAANGAAPAALYTDKAAEAFYALTERMLSVNEQMNLTAITDPEEIIVKHYADSALAAPLIPEGASIADVGTGGGFPSLPLAILRPDLTILAIDSTKKKLDYVGETARLLGLSNLSVRVGRAEELGRDPLIRESFDLVCARAVARLNVLSEWCMPLVKKGGRFLAMKAKSGEEELTEAARAIELLGGAPAECVRHVLCGPYTDGTEEGMERFLILVKKRQYTPGIYPRSNAQISKKPL